MSAVLVPLRALRSLGRVRHLQAVLRAELPGPAAVLERDGVLLVPALFLHLEQTDGGRVLLRARGLLEEVIARRDLGLRDLETELLGRDVRARRSLLLLLLLSAVLEDFYVHVFRGRLVGDHEILLQQLLVWSLIGAERKNPWQGVLLNPVSRLFRLVRYFSLARRRAPVRAALILVGVRSLNRTLREHLGLLEAIRVVLVVVRLIL